MDPDLDKGCLSCKNTSLERPMSSDLTNCFITDFRNRCQAHLSQGGRQQRRQGYISQDSAVIDGTREFDDEAIVFTPAVATKGLLPVIVRHHHGQIHNQSNKNQQEHRFSLELASNKSTTCLIKYKNFNNSQINDESSDEQVTTTTAATSGEVYSNR